MSRRAVLLTAAALLPRPVLAGAEPPERILVFGDSQAQGLAGGVQRLYRADRSRRVLDRSKISTGLNPRSSYDWPAQARILAGDKPDVAVALFGANDRPSVRINGQMDFGLLDRFTEIYAARVSDIARCFHEANVPLVWLGHPIVRDSVYAEDMALLNDIFASRAEAEGATFIPTWDIFKGPDGQFSPYGRGVDGQTTRLRADDGVHLTPAGYDVLTALLVPTFDRYRPKAEAAAHG